MTVTLDEVAELAAVDPDIPRRVWRAMGLPDGDVSLSEADADALAAVVATAGDGDNLDFLVHRARVLAAATARVADVVGEALGDRPPWAWASEAALVEFLVRRHVGAAVARRSRGDLPSGTRSLAVGFADLAGYTALSQGLLEGELSGLVARFEEVAYRSVGETGARVVKMIGDEVMFVAEDPRTVVEAALRLGADARADEVLPDVRAGLSVGPVLTRQGDCYGPVVNLAHRIVRVAAPGEVAVSGGVREALAGDSRFCWESRGERSLKGIGAVTVWRVTEAATSPGRGPAAPASSPRRGPNPVRGRETCAQ